MTQPFHCFLATGCKNVHYYIQAGMYCDFENVAFYDVLRNAWLLSHLLLFLSKWQNYKKLLLKFKYIHISCYCHPGNVFHISLIDLIALNRPDELGQINKFLLTQHPPLITSLSLRYKNQTKILIIATWRSNTISLFSKSTYQSYITTERNQSFSGIGPIL